jgi:hypothetical protein
MALVIECRTVEVPEPPPSLNIPNFGVIDKAWSGLNKIPSNDEMMMQFLDAIAAAMAPVKRYLEIVEAFNAVYKCFQALTDALMQLSPDPIFDCLKYLVKTVLKILSWIPPLSYIRLAMDVTSYVIDIIDEIVTYFAAVDAKIDDLISAYNDGITFGDLELIRIVNCGALAQKARMVMIFDTLKFVKPLNDALVDMFIRLLPGGENIKQLKKIKEMYEEADTYVTNAGEAMRNGEDLPSFEGGSTVESQHVVVQVPPLGDFLAAMNQQRNAMVMLYNLLAPLVGSDGNKQAIDTPSFNNF